MTIFFASTSIADFKTSTGTNVYRSTARKADKVSESIFVGRESNISTTLHSPVNSNEFWLSFHNNGTGTVDECFIELFENDLPILRLYGDNALTDTIDIQLHDGLVYNTLTSIAITTNDLKKIDVRIIKHPTNGSIETYVDNVLYSSVTNINTELTSWVGLDKLTIGCTATSGAGGMYLSAILLTDESTLNWLFIQSIPTNFGTFDEWVGTVNNITDGSDITYLVGDTSGQRFVVDSIIDDTLQTGYTVVGNMLSIRASKIGNGLSTLKAIDYTNSNIYKSSGQNVVSNNVDVLQFISYVNPDTSLAWTEQTLENTQFGLELT